MILKFDKDKTYAYITDEKDVPLITFPLEQEELAKYIIDTIATNQATIEQQKAAIKTAKEKIGSISLEEVKNYEYGKILQEVYVVLKAIEKE
jgi:hypothetical protein